MTKRFFRFAYFGPRDRNTKSHRIHQLRDGAAFMEIAAVLYKKGYEYSGLILNHPPPNSNSSQPLLKIETHFGKEDILVVTTRPPFDLIKQSSEKLPREVVDPGYTSIEAKLCTELSHNFQHLNQKHVSLSDKMKKELRIQLAQKNAAYLNRAELTFGMNASIRGLYESARNPDTDEIELFKGRKLSSAYLIYKDVDRKKWPNGPGQILVCIGITGPLSLIWAYAVRNRFPNFLDKPKFVMAEISRQQMIPERPTNLSFSDEWQIDVLLNTPL